jgi:3-hydroxyisobutyrate dehydrogenase-like beta-hydroxyacid dehydrogenase
VLLKPVFLPAGSTADACRGADIVISAVTADSAITAAAQAAPHLMPSQFYIDLNSISPATKKQVAEPVDQRGAHFVEFAVMAPVSGIGLEVPILSGGERAEEVSARLNDLGMKITAGQYGNWDSLRDQTVPQHHHQGHGSADGGFHPRGGAGRRHAGGA